jgi:hypothetical protein
VRQSNRAEPPSRGFGLESCQEIGAVTSRCRLSIRAIGCWRSAIPEDGRDTRSHTLPIDRRHAHDDAAVLLDLVLSLGILPAVIGIRAPAGRTAPRFPHSSARRDRCASCRRRGSTVSNGDATADRSLGPLNCRKCLNRWHLEMGTCRITIHYSVGSLAGSTGWRCGKYFSGSLGTAGGGVADFPLRMR